MKHSSLRRPTPSLWLAAACLVWSDCSGAVPGALDPDFHGTGWMAGRLEENCFLSRITVQADGRIVGTGWKQLSYGMDTAIFRFMPDGTPDLSFNGSGRLVVSASDRFDSAGFVAFQSDGKIVVAGEGHLSAIFGGILVMRCHADGTLDTGFGYGHGYSIEGTGTRDDYPKAHALAVQPDDRILVSVDIRGLLRFDAGGRLDTAFGEEGRVGSVRRGFGAGLAVQADGRILIGDAEDEVLRVTRLLPNGDHDITFGTGSEATIALPGGSASVTCIVPQIDGTILVGGHYVRGPDDSRMVVARFLSNGTPDPAFHQDGWNECDFRPGGTDIPHSLLVQDDGKILLAGNSTDDTLTDQSDLAFARFLPNGSLDESFGTGGIVRTDLAGAAESSRSAALLPDGRLITNGVLTRNPEFPEYLLARYRIHYRGMTVEQPPGQIVRNGGGPARDFGALVPPAGLMEFAIRNNGPEILTNISVAVIEESHPGQFGMSSGISSSAAAGGQITFAVSFTPDNAPGVRTATLRVTSSDTEHSPWLIPITGRRATPLQAWRYAWFGATDNSGAGANLNDFDGDGLPNVLEYSTGSDPHHHTLTPGTLAVSGGMVSFTYARTKAALTELSFQVEAAESLAGPWSAEGVTETILTDDGVTQAVKAGVSEAAGAGAPVRFVRLRVTVR